MAGEVAECHDREERQPSTVFIMRSEVQLPSGQLRKLRNRIVAGLLVSFVASLAVVLWEGETTVVIRR